MTRTWWPRHWSSLASWCVFLPRRRDEESKHWAPATAGAEHPTMQPAWDPWSYRSDRARGDVCEGCGAVPGSWRPSFLSVRYRRRCPAVAVLGRRSTTRAPHPNCNVRARRAMNGRHSAPTVAHALAPTIARQRCRSGWFKQVVAFLCGGWAPLAAREPVASRQASPRSCGLVDAADLVPRLGEQVF